jgi:hypothetical protein
MAAARTSSSPALASVPKQRVLMRLGASLLLVCLLALSLLHLLSPHPPALSAPSWSGALAHAAPLAISPLLVWPVMNIILSLERVSSPTILTGLAEIFLPV